MLWLSLLAIAGLLLYWELIIAEGAHLGPRVVVYLYDLIAWRYDRIKNFDLAVEAHFLGLPLAEAVSAVQQPQVLDVAAGTGRVARALFRQIAFDGAVVNLDLAGSMLAEGKRQCARLAIGDPDQMLWVRGAAGRLPFGPESFDVVTCLEALEFFPSARAALAECVRVLRPGGLLLLTNRVGWEAWLMAGKTLSRGGFRRMLAEFPLEGISVQPWQVGYDLGWARKRAAAPEIEAAGRAAGG